MPCLLDAQDTKITVYHIQVALRSNADFAHVLASVESAALVLEYIMDDATSKALFDRHLIATRDAKHLRLARMGNGNGICNGDGGDQDQEAHELASEEELIRLHERTRSEWQKREDDPFSEVDFVMVLKCVHPAFTLSYNATILLSALIRELLNEVCDLAQIETVQRRVPPELYLEDIDKPLARIFHFGESGKQIAKMALDCLERFRLRSRKGTSLAIRFRLNVPRDTLYLQLAPQMCKKYYEDAATMAAICRGHQIELQTTPAALSIPTGGVVYLVSKKRWDCTRRNEARRGLLSSLRPQDAQLMSTLDDARLGFAAISDGVRSMDEKIAKWQSADSAELLEQQQQQQDHSESQQDAALPSQEELAELESELLSRLEKTEELVAQTVEQVRHTRQQRLRRSSGADLKK